MEFADAVVSALDESATAALVASPDFRQALDAFEREARASHPAIDVEPAQFAKFVAIRLGSGGPAVLRKMRPQDLYLACACLDGRRQALQTLEQSYFPELARTAGRFDVEGCDAAELMQQLRVKLLVGDGDRPPKLADYDGQGHLQNWLRVTAVRLFIDVQRSVNARARREQPQSLPSGAAASANVEMDFLKAEYREHFRAAFAYAVQALAPQPRATLRYHAVGKLSIDQIAAIYHVHRATAARQLAAARGQLLQLVREEIMRIARIDAAEVDSAIALVQSQLDVSLSRLLATTVDP